MVCENCGKEHNGTYASGRFCCRSCSNSYSSKSNNDERIKNIKKASEKAIAEGRHHRFDGTSKIIETFWYNELLSRGLKVEMHYPVNCDNIRNNNHFYRLDFLINDSIDLEIDGIFHNTDKYTINKDKIRDDYLKSVGYKIYRVSYVNPKRNYEIFIKQVNDFVEWLNKI